MKQTEMRNIQSSLPFDIALKIASHLEVLDVCALGCCSRFWSELCRSDCLWEFLTKERWPSVSFISDFSPCSVPVIKGWREIYIKMHREMAGKATTVIEFVEHRSLSQSLEIGDYNKAIQDLWLMRLAFKDIQMFLFKPNLNVLLNLVGLHYCIFCLKLPARNVMDALLSCKISEREVCVNWWKLGRWFYGFRMRDESHSRKVSLTDLTTDKGEDVLGVLQRGAIHEVLRVEIFISNATTSPWSSQSSHRQY
ncbi:hypothetical protein JCGZ_02020 [Jatropha curcas]|uniref:F-box domain-containing protein n=1 Tax=Jatropha curcas TaxID=180498 RepID=A0A067KV42_JATCU|nr:uncharacterized protein LOC105631825 [Jatropha curcas]KDP40022.1 hypothetical protein JCGZ_02020 [Jatropha curcas]